MIDLSRILTKQQRKAIVNAILTPFSWLYTVGVWVRNKCFDWGILRQVSFDVPVISVGNITVGGTGKTPHVEYIIEALCRHYNIGVLSRGYKRETRGFILATGALSPHDLGDEPYQIYHKYNGLITLAVCEDRRKGIREMLAINPEINLFLLDDAFQHRYVKPKVNIVLADFNRPPFNDKMMPLGNLREPCHRILHCDFVIVTKCPSDITPIDIRMMRESWSVPIAGTVLLQHTLCRPYTGVPYQESTVAVTVVATTRRPAAGSDWHSQREAIHAVSASIPSKR